MRAEHPTASIDDLTSAPSTGSSGYESQDIRHDIQVALNTLSPTERTLIILRYNEDRPIKEITRITGLPEGTVKVYLSRARTKMAKAMES